ncbi:MAG: hypothetical protein KA198_04750 [Chitinophagaceae bacterium]|nr:hypothetical protein [Chitinophagaceae bacterium]
MKKWLLLFILFSVTAHAKKIAPFKVGEATLKDYYSIPKTLDTSSGAVVMAHYGEITFDASMADGFFQRFRELKRVKIINSKGYSAAQIVLPDIHAYGYRNEIEEVTGYVYNVEKGQLIKRKLEKSDLYHDEFIDEVDVQKIAFPQVKEGSMIEVDFTLRRTTLTLPDWDFQCEYPTLWSGLETHLPEVMQYTEVSQQIEKYNEFYRSEYMMDTPLLQGRKQVNVVHSAYIMKDIPAMPDHDEVFAPARRNYLQSLHFQLSEIRIAHYTFENFSDWEHATKTLNSPTYLNILKKDANKLERRLKDIVGTKKDTLEISKAIYNYVTHEYSLNRRNKKFQPVELRRIDSSKSGSVSDLNILVMQLHQSAGITANPVLISSKSHWFAHPIYPILERFNYIITHVVIQGRDYFLDAANPEIGYGQLVSDLYNYDAKEITPEKMIPLDLNPENITEKSMSYSQFEFDANGKMTITITKQMGSFESCQFRKDWTSRDSLSRISLLKSKLPKGIELSSYVLNNVSTPGESVEEVTTLTSNLNASLLYINPFVGMSIEKWFESTQRILPIQFPSRRLETNIMVIPIPDGYRIDEVPSSSQIDLDQQRCLLNYLVDTLDNQIRIKVTTQINSTFYPVSEYPTLLDFSNKQAARKEQLIVFKKK